MALAPLQLRSSHRALRLTLTAAATTALIILASCAPAWADGHGDRHLTKRSWYGWQTLASDGASLIVVLLPIAAGASASDALGSVAVGVALGGYLLGTPITHAAHGRWSVAADSLGLRAGSFLAGSSVAIVGTLTAKESSACESCLPSLIGLSIMLLPIAIDAAALSYEDDHRAEAGAAARCARRVPPQPSGMSIVPAFGTRKEGGLDVGLGGTF